MIRVKNYFLIAGVEIDTLGEKVSRKQSYK